MKNFLVKTGLAVTGILVVTGTLSAIVLAQDDSEAERRARMEERRLEMEQRRAEYLENNPEEAARMEARRREREAYMADNPEAAARMEERRAEMRERYARGEGRPRGEQPGFDGRRPGPPPGGPRFRDRVDGRGPYPGDREARRSGAD